VNSAILRHQGRVFGCKWTQQQNGRWKDRVPGVENGSVSANPASDLRIQFYAVVFSYRM
jgi:hypothetical protein